MTAPPVQQERRAARLGAPLHRATGTSSIVHSFRAERPDASFRRCRKQRQPNRSRTSGRLSCVAFPDEESVDRLLDEAGPKGEVARCVGPEADLQPARPRPSPGVQNGTSGARWWRRSLRLREPDGARPRIGVLILVDEVQEASSDELVAVNVAVDELGHSGTPLPVAFVGAGLPSLPAQLAGATSYAERLYDYRSVGLLDEAGSRAALVVPARDLAVGWEPGALSAALETARGYPYSLQAIGKHAWDDARQDPIDADDVDVGLQAERKLMTVGRPGRVAGRQRSLVGAPPFADHGPRVPRLGGEPPREGVCLCPVDTPVPAWKTPTDDRSGVA
jgi:hypothetical protein